ncbi:hypothetical protein T11_7095 [Trichinella zimbabwensis]|uniref:Uncharacterized protein n=1 Tax=Trichinella zimbabwensis TaxID=268475 RepID=A0A0V1GWK5_9BILA|nr:hypothetical protein T11_7095 [Trichinella zimbabwensis]
MSNGADRAMVLRVRRPEPFRQRLSGLTTGSGGAASRQGRGISSILLSPQPLTEALHSVCILRNRSAEEAKSIPAIRDEAAASRQAGVRRCNIHQFRSDSCAKAESPHGNLASG